LLDKNSHDLFVVVQCPEGPLLIFSHEAAISLHIRTQDGGELTFEFFCWHGVISLKFYNGNAGDKDI
jgi:hypothetical protein